MVIELGLCELFGGWNMFGAILGDIIGSSHEFKLKVVSKNEFELFNKKSRFTDDTVMSVAISDVYVRNRKRC